MVSSLQIYENLRLRAMKPEFTKLFKNIFYILPGMLSLVSLPLNLYTKNKSYLVDYNYFAYLANFAVNTLGTNCAGFLKNLDNIHVFQKLAGILVKFFHKLFHFNSQTVGIIVQ